MRSINRGVLLMMTFLALMGSLAEAAEVTVTNNSNFSVEVKWKSNDPERDGKFTLEKGESEAVDIDKDETIKFWFEDVGTISTEMVAHISQSLTASNLKAVGGSLGVLMPACSLLGTRLGKIAPAVFLIVAVTGASVKYLYEVWSTNSITVPGKTLKKDRQFVIDIKDRNKSAFLCALMQEQAQAAAGKTKAKQPAKKKDAKRRPVAPVEQAGDDTESEVETEQRDDEVEAPPAVLPKAAGRKKDKSPAPITVDDQGGASSRRLASVVAASSVGEAPEEAKQHDVKEGGNEADGGEQEVAASPALVEI